MAVSQLTKAQRAEIAKLYGDGWSSTDLARRYEQQRVKVDDVLAIVRAEGGRVRDKTRRIVTASPLPDFKRRA